MTTPSSTGFFKGFPAPGKRIIQLADLGTHLYAVMRREVPDGEPVTALFECVAVALVEQNDADDGRARAYVDYIYVHSKGSALASDGHDGWAFDELAMPASDDMEGDGGESSGPLPGDDPDEPEEIDFESPADGR